MRWYEQLLLPFLPSPPSCLSIRLVSHLYLTCLSAQTSCLRPEPKKKNLPVAPGGSCPVIFLVATCLTYQRPLSPPCPWILGGSGYKMYLLVPWETLHSKWNGQDMVLPAQPRMSAQFIGQPLSGPALSPGWRFPWASVSCGFGLPSLWDLHKTKQLHGSFSACCHSQRHNCLGANKWKNHLNVY